jgi:hypothetical protein
MDHIGALHELHFIESAAECLEFVDSLLVDNTYVFPAAEHVEDGVRTQNSTNR